MRTEAAFSFPTPVRFGADVLDEIESDLRRFQIKRPLVVCDKFLTETDAFRLLEDALKNTPTTIFRDVHPNPLEADVSGAAQAYQAADCDGIIGLGGGSALDVAKVCRLKIQCSDFQLQDQTMLERGNKRST